MGDPMTAPGLDLDTLEWCVDFMRQAGASGVVISMDEADALIAAARTAKAATTSGVYWHSEIQAWVIDVPQHGAMKLTDALAAERQQREQAEQREERLKRAITRHRVDVWGSGPIDHDSDRELYAALAEGQDG